GGERVLRLLVREAGDRVGGTHPARVEADDVELSTHLLGEQRAAALVQRLHTRAAGSAEVQEQRSDLLLRVGGRQPGHRDRGGPPVRLVVVAGYLHAGAVELLEPLAAR